MLLMLSMESVDVNSINMGESASAGEEQETHPGYYWMCGLCLDKPKFETLELFFNHKLENHIKNANTDDDKKHIEVSDSIFSPAPFSDKLSYDGTDEEENLPLATLKAKLSPLKLKIKIKRKKRRSKKEKFEAEVETQAKNTNETEKSDYTSADVQAAISQAIEESESNQENYCNDLKWEAQFSPEEIKVEIDSSCDGSQEPEKRKQYCKICNEEFSSRKSLSKHKATHKCPETGEYKCESCGKLCPKFDNFVRHLQIHLENRPKTFQCGTCSTSFYNMADLKRHNVLHMEVKPFKCKYCEEGFIRHDALLAHEAKHTGVPYVKHVCKLCGKIFNSPSALAMHSKNHTNKSIFCSEPGCQFSCYLMCQLRQHVRTHSGEKPFQCAQCGRCFGRSNDMKNHILNVHQHFRPHKCPDCPKQFTLLSSLKTHRVSHSDIRPYLCAECGKRFNHPSTLRKHTQFLHSDQAKRARKKEVEVEVKPVVDVGVQSNLTMVSTALMPAVSMAGMNVPVTVTGMSVPVTIHIPHLASLNLEPGYTQAYVIPTVAISPQLIRQDGI